MKSGCLCLCGCFEETNMHRGKPNRYINGHNARTKEFSDAHKGKPSGFKGKKQSQKCIEKLRGNKNVLGKHWKLKKPRTKYK